MKVYVDELPKDCFECPCFRNNIENCCGLDDGTKDYHKFIEDSNCPLNLRGEHINKNLLVENMKKLKALQDENKKLKQLVNDLQKK